MLIWKWETVSHIREEGSVVDLEDHPFSETEGLLKRFGENPTVLDFVQLYLTDKIFDLLVTETNRFVTCSGSWW